MITCSTLFGYTINSLGLLHFLKTKFKVYFSKGRLLGKFNLNVGISTVSYFIVTLQGLIWLMKDGYILYYQVSEDMSGKFYNYHRMYAAVLVIIIGSFINVIWPELTIKNEKGNRIEMLKTLLNNSKPQMFKYSLSLLLIFIFGDYIIENIFGQEYVIVGSSIWIGLNFLALGFGNIVSCWLLATNRVYLLGLLGLIGGVICTLLQLNLQIFAINNIMKVNICFYLIFQVIPSCIIIYSDSYEKEICH